MKAADTNVKLGGRWGAKFRVGLLLRGRVQP